MEITIGKKCFDKIKAGAKDVVFKDLPVVFYCKETGELMDKQVFRVDMTVLPESNYNLVKNIEKHMASLKTTFDQIKLQGDYEKA